MKRTLLRWHLGLGDALLCNGLVRVLVERGQNLALPCKAHNEASLKAMFADLGEAVEVFATQDMALMTKALGFSDAISLGGYDHHTFDPLRFDESFYRQAGVPFLAKWEKFSLPEMKFDEYVPRDIFLHDDPKRLMNIEENFDEPIMYLPDPSKSFWSHLPYLMTAKEIHCISSCFAILADLINAPGKKFLHRYARPDGGALPIFGREWTILAKPL